MVIGYSLLERFVFNGTGRNSIGLDLKTGFLRTWIGFSQNLKSLILDFWFLQDLDQLLSGRLVVARDKPDLDIGLVWWFFWIRIAIDF